MDGNTISLVSLDLLPFECFRALNGPKLRLALMGYPNPLADIYPNFLVSLDLLLFLRVPELSNVWNCCLLWWVMQFHWWMASLFLSGLTWSSFIFRGFRALKGLKLLPALMGYTTPSVDGKLISLVSPDVLLFSRAAELSKVWNCSLRYWAKSNSINGR